MFDLVKIISRFLYRGVHALNFRIRSPDLSVGVPYIVISDELGAATRIFTGITAGAFLRWGGGSFFVCLYSVHMASSVRA